MNICSDFHLGRHFLGLAMNAFVGNFVTLWLGISIKRKDYEQENHHHHPARPRRNDRAGADNAKGHYQWSLLQ